MYSLDVSLKHLVPSGNHVYHLLEH